MTPLLTLAEKAQRSQQLTAFSVAYGALEFSGEKTAHHEQHPVMCCNPLSQPLQQP